MFEMTAGVILFDHVFYLRLNIHYVGRISAENAKFEFILCRIDFCES